MVARYYSNTSVATTITSLVSDSTTTIPVDSVSGLPSTPFTAILEPGTAQEELVEITAVAGNNLTATRGIDGTPAQPHAISSTIVHGVSARDWREPMEHIDDTTSVHGIANTAALVLLTGAQTLTGKTLTSPTINGGTVNSATLTTPTIASFANAQHTHEDAASGGELGESGGGGSSSSTAYKRSGSGEVSISSSDDATAGTALTFGTSVHSVGNATWTTASSNTRVVLPSDITTGYWHVSVNCKATNVGSEAFVFVTHQDLGTIAYSLDWQDADSFGIHEFSLSTDFSSSASKWIEVRLGCIASNLSNVNYVASVALHRIA